MKEGLLHLKTLVITNNPIAATSFPPHHLISFPISPLLSAKSSTFRITLLGFFSPRLNLPLWQEFIIIFSSSVAGFYGFKHWCVHVSYKDWGGLGRFMYMGGLSHLRKASLPSQVEVWSQEQPWRRWARKELSGWRSSRSFFSWSWWRRLCPDTAPDSTRRSLRF